MKIFPHTVHDLDIWLLLVILMRFCQGRLHYLFYGGKVYSDDIYTYINNKNNQRIFISDKNISNREFNLTRLLVAFRLRDMD